MQADLAKSSVTIQIKQNDAQARKADAEGAAAFTRTTGEADAHVVKVKGESDAYVIQAKGQAEATAIEAQGIARATGYEKQREALGSDATALVAVFSEISHGQVKIVPDVLVGSGGPLDGLAAMLTQRLAANGAEPGNGDIDEVKAKLTGRKRTETSSRADAPSA
jgi:uncharacterized membrane protein YqiK